MKIFHLCKTYYPETLGGIEKCVDTLSRSLKKLDIDSVVVTTTFKKSAWHRSEEKYSVRYYPAFFTFASCPVSLSLLTNFRKTIKEADILHLQFPWPFADILLILFSRNKPIVVTFHSEIVKQSFLKIIYNPIMHALFKKSRAIVVTSENLFNSTPILHRYKHKVHIVPHGIDVESYPESSERLIFWEKKLHKLGIKKNEAFLSIGVLRYYKGLQFLLSAVTHTTIPVLIVGDGPEETYLKEMAKKNNLTNVHFLGMVSDEDKIALLRLCRSVVSSAHLRSEAFCISLLEGLLFGKPLISTKLHTGTSFVNTHGVTGLVVPPKDPAALRQALEILSSDSDRYNEFERNIHFHYKKYFTSTRMAEAYGHIYRKLLNDN